MKRSSRPARCLLALLAGAPVTACRGAAPPAAGETLTVFAASSLREAFTTLGETLERRYPGARVTFAFAGSQELRAQIEHGAPADVFASADTRHMQALREAGLVDAPIIFARNEPVIAVGAGTTGIASLGDLPRARRLVIGAPDVPIGRYTLQILDRAAATLGPDFRARVEARVVSRELNVRQVLAKLRLGEADAAVVYRTDARAAGAGVEEVAIPPEINVTAEYPIAIVARTPRPPLARAWLALVASAEGRAALRTRGFLTPEPLAAAPEPAEAGRPRTP